MPGLKVTYWMRISGEMVTSCMVKSAPAETICHSPHRLGVITQVSTRRSGAISTTWTRRSAPAVTTFTFPKRSLCLQLQGVSIFGSGADEKSVKARIKQLI